MLLLTGATGTIGLPLLRRLTAAGTPVRCLVRDPRRLGAERVRVQIALGDLGDPASFRHALRGVETVVHLAATIRDQHSGSIEELAGLATWRLVQAAERAEVSRFLFFSTLGASTGAPTRLQRAKALAERAVRDSSIPHTMFAPSFVYSPGDRFLRILERLSLLPAVPLIGSGRPAFQPMWADDVADCVIGALSRDAAGETYELAGPEVLTYEEIVRCALRSFGRRRALVDLPTGLVRRTLKLLELVMGPAAFATWDEVELLTVPMVSPRGTADVESLGVTPHRMAAVLGVA